MNEETLNREFILDNPERWEIAQRFIEANRIAFALRNNPLRLIVTSAESKRNAEQNKYYWRGVLQQIEEQAWVDGKQFKKEVWHEFFAKKFGYYDEMSMPDGEIILRRKSTTEYKVREFADYTTSVTAYGAQELGVRFYLNEEA